PGNGEPWVRVSIQHFGSRIGRGRVDRGQQHPPTRRHTIHADYNSNGLGGADEPAEYPNHRRTSEIDEPVKHEREAVWIRPAPSGNDFRSEERRGGKEGK